MKTPVIQDSDADRQALEESYANSDKLECKKLFPGTELEIQKPTVKDVVGFLVCVGVCFGIIGLAVLIAGLGMTP